MSLNDVYLLGLKVLATIGHLILGYARQHPWALVVALYGLARAFGVLIQSGQRGVLFRWGMVDRELDPGFHWLIPIVHGVKVTPVRSITIDLPNQMVMTADGLVYDVGVNAIYRVEDTTKALTLVDHVDVGCRNAIPIIVTEVLRVRDQAQLVDRVSLDRELFERMHAWVARWGLVIEQAGFTTIAPNKGVLHTTQLRSKTMERAAALRALLDGGLDAESSLIMIGTERKLVAKSSLSYHRRTRQPGRAYGAHWQEKKKASVPIAAVAKAEQPAKAARAKPESKSTLT